MSEMVSLSEALANIRDELEKAQVDGKARRVRFVPTSVEVELCVVFSKEAQGQAGVKAWVLDASGEVKATTESTHKVTLVLEPTGPDGQPTLVSDVVSQGAK